VYTLAFTYLAFFYLAVDLGLNGYFLSFYDQDKDLPNKLFNFRLVWSGILLVLSCLLLPFWPFSTTAFVITVLIGSATIVLNGIFNSTNFVFQHHLAYWKSSIGTIVGSLVSLAVAVPLAFSHLPIFYFALVPTLGWVANTAVCLALSKQFYFFKLEKVDLLFPLETFRKAWPVAATLVVNTLYFRIDSFILSGSKTFADVGNYNVAYTIFQDVLVIPAFIMNGYYPLMLRALKENYQVFKKEVLWGAGAMGGLGLLGLLGVYILSPLGIQILTGGGFDGAVSSLRILSVSFPAFFITSLLVWVMMARKLYKQMFFIYLFGFIFNLRCGDAKKIVLAAAGDHRSCRRLCQGF
jgi:O-antigen/teichoic acid export membrane protein